MINKYCSHFIGNYGNDQVICGRVATHKITSDAGKVTPVCEMHS